MATELDAAGLLNYRAATMLDRGERVTKESAMAKLFASEAAVRIAGEAVQIHGGAWFIQEFSVGEIYCAGEAPNVWGGSTQIPPPGNITPILKDNKPSPTPHPHPPP